MDTKKWAIGLLSAGLSLGSIGYSFADDKPKTDSKTEEKKDEAIKVPDGTAEELMKFIQSHMPSRSRRLEAKDVQAVIEAEAKIAADAKADDKVKDQARSAKITTLFAGKRVKKEFGKDLTEFKAAVLKSFPGTDSASLAEGYDLVEKYFQSNTPPGDEAGAELMAFAEKYPKSDIGFSMNYQFMMMNADKDAKKAIPQLEKLAKIYSANKQKVSAIEGMLKGLKIIGSPMEIEGPTLAGSNFDIKSFKGKVVVVDFWATWCGPCVAAMPSLEEVYKKYNKDGMEVVAVSLDQSREDLEGFVKEKKIPWTQIFYPPKSGTPNPLAEKYGINAIPAMYLIGKDGNVVSKVNAHDKESLEKAVAEELKKAPKTAG